MDNNYIIGLDDICINDKIIFDCKCVSTDGADVYEFDFAKYKKALKDYNLMYKNNIEFNSIIKLNKVKHTILPIEPKILLILTENLQKYFFIHNKKGWEELKHLYILNN